MLIILAILLMAAQATTVCMDWPYIAKYELDPSYSFGDGVVNTTIEAYDIWYGSYSELRNVSIDCEVECEMTRSGLLASYITNIKKTAPDFKYSINSDYPVTSGTYFWRYIYTYCTYMKTDAVSGAKTRTVVP